MLLKSRDELHMPNVNVRFFADTPDDLLWLSNTGEIENGNSLGKNKWRISRI